MTTAARLSLRARAILGATTALAAVPMLVELALGDRARKFSMSASDTFYYLTVGRNIAASGRPSFDGEHLTNGFHPLWQMVCAALMGVVRVTHADAATGVVLALVVSALLVGLTVYFLGLALATSEGDLSPFFLILPVGAGTIIFSGLSQLGWHSTGRPSASLWGSVNGMESAATLAAYAMLVTVYTRAPRDRAYPYVLGVAMCLLAFARLDHAVFSLSVGLGLLFLDDEPGARGAHARALGVFAAALLAYCVVNRAVFGLAVPISGALKSTFPEVTRTNQSLLRKLLSSPRHFTLSRAQRGLQMAIPAGAAVLHLSILVVGWWLRRRTLKRVDRILCCTAPAVIALSLYDFLFVPTMNQGFWYFPVSFLYVSVCTIRAADTLLERLLTPARSALLAVAMGGLTLGGFFWLRVVWIGPSARADFYYEDAPRLRALYRGKNPKILEYDDGIVAFSTGFPAMSGMGLTVDVGAVDAAGGIGIHRTGHQHLIDLAIARGFTRFCTLDYPGRPKLRLASSDRDIRRAYARLIGRQARSSVLHVEYVSRTNRFSMIEAQPR